MSDEPETEDRRRQDRRRHGPHNDDETPAQRPNDEVPANRREDPNRAGEGDEQERKDRRGS